mgnify:CR=1 FL=1
MSGRSIYRGVTRSTIMCPDIGPCSKIRLGACVQYVLPCSVLTMLPTTHDPPGLDREVVNR